MTDQFSVFQKGTHVLVHATVHTKNRHYLPSRFMDDWMHPVILRKVELDPRIQIGGKSYPRNFVKVHCEVWEGVVVGWSTRISGEHVPGYDWDNPGELRQAQTHKVLMVIPLYTQRWTPPYACIPEDLEII